VFAGLAVAIACLGVFALAAFAAQRRTREIGIRRALGAGIPRLTGLLTVDFVRIALLAGLSVMPFAWWGMRSWIDSFACRTALDPFVFAGSAVVVVFVTAAAAGCQALRAALCDPVEALRHD
jgi:putative ABC transport system permease protein